MGPLHKFVSLFHSDSKNQKKLISQKIFSSELNICSEDFKNQWGTLNGYQRTIKEHGEA